MTMHARLLAEGPGWRVRDMICTAGPQDRPFEERHEWVSVAAVTNGTFLYRTVQGSALLGPGAMLLGNHGYSFECRHEHGIGDRCLSFHFAPDYWEAVAAALPGVRKAVLSWPRLPPTNALLALTAALEAARDSAPAALEEAAVELAGSVLQLQELQAPAPQRAGARDERHISEAVRLIESMACDPEATLSLGHIARQVGMSPYHFLRSFRDIVGMTPHQYGLHRRMHRAAVLIRLTTEPISAIAFGVGFNDLSTFNRRFRKLLGTTPLAYRSGRGR